MSDGEQKIMRKLDKAFLAMEKAGFLAPEPPSVVNARAKAEGSKRVVLPLRSYTERDRFRGIIRQGKVSTRARNLLLYSIGTGTTLKPIVLLTLQASDVTILSVPEQCLRVKGFIFRVGDIEDYNEICTWLKGLALNGQAEELLFPISVSRLSKWVEEMALKAGLVPEEGCCYSGETLRKTYGFMLFLNHPFVTLNTLMTMYNSNSAGHVGNYLCIPVNVRDKEKDLPDIIAET